MTRKNTNYRRLPGKKRSFLIGYYTLWRGTDHLLLVYSRFGIEDYRRFYFADIQSIITHKTVTGKIQNLILGMFLLIFGVMALMMDGGGAIFGGIMAGCFIIFLFINWFRGPTCVTHLKTAVQTEKLHSLHRLKNAQKVMDGLRPLIEQIQGHLTPEALKQNDLNQQQPRPASLSPSRPKQSLNPIHNESGTAHFTLFSLMLFDGLLVVLNAFLHLSAITLLSTLTSMGIGICVIVALVKQHQSDIPQVLRNLTWMGLGYVCVSFIMSYIFTMVLSFQNPQIWVNQWQIIERVAAMSFFDNALVGSLHILTLCSACCLGIPGLILMNKHRKTLKRSPAKPKASLSASSPVGNQ
jgi:hypothetical protein